MLREKNLRMSDLLTKFFLLNIIYTVAVVTSSSRVKYSRTRIINGENAEQFDFNYHVSIQLNGEHLCGGAIIADQFVLTAAHCFFKNGDMTEYNGELTVKSGTNYLHGSAYVDQIEEIMVLLDYVNVHSYYYAHQMDIAVLKLKDKLNLDGYYVQKINLPEDYVSSPFEGDTVTIAGYGYTEDAHIHFDGNETQVDGSTSAILKTIQTRVINQVDCHNAHGGIEINEKHICTYRARYDDDPNRYGECYGDSGSPLKYENTVVGVVSSGPALCGDRDLPTIYTKVSYYLDFIRNALHELPNGEMVIYKKSNQDGHYYWS